LPVHHAVGVTFVGEKTVSDAFLLVVGRGMLSCLSFGGDKKRMGGKGARVTPVSMA